MQVFHLVLKNETRRAYTWISYFLFLLNIISFVFIFINNSKTLPLVSALLLILLLTLKLFTRKFESKKIFGTGFLIACISWALVGYYLLAVLQLLFLVLELRSHQKKMIDVAADKIRTSLLFKRAIEWNELSNVVLKDGLLTIDFKNNKILQAELAGESDRINEELFNRFCMDRLQQNE